MKNLAILSFLLSFLLSSCGDDSGSSVNDLSEEAEISSSSSEKANRDSKSSSSSSEKANKDSKSSSSSSEKAEKLPVINKTISGMAQGPFEKGATVSVYELDTNFQQTGISYETKIKNDSGSYSIKLEDFKSQYALFKVNGRYIDNITGAKSAYSITLYAFTDLDNHDNVNINFLTHLSYKRILYLTNEKDIPVTSAKKQAETEVLRAFDIENDGFDDAENIDFFGKDKQSAALLVMSVLLQSHLLDENLNNRLTDFTSYIETYGTWNNEETKTEIADWASYLSQNTAFEKIKGYIKKWNQTVDLSILKKYMDNFWQQNYDLGECTDKQENRIKENRNKLSSFGEEHFICRSSKWEIATSKEIDDYPNIDTLNSKIAKDSDIRWLDSEKRKCEVYDDTYTTWRIGHYSECEYGFGGCTHKRENTKVKKGDRYYICKNKMWLTLGFRDSYPIEYELDTLDWKDTTEGAIRKGNVTDVVYIFDNQKWRVATIPEASLGGCNEKNVGNFGYAESRIKQALSKLECILYPEFPEDNECFRIVYNPGYYICKKNRRESPQNRYETIFSWDWEHIRYREYTSICNNPSDDADSKKVNPYWGNFTPVREKCINCNQESIDHFEDQCKKRCYVSGNIAHASACVLGIGCMYDFYGTIKEGPSMELASDTIFYEDEYYSEHLYYLSYPISIDSTKKTKYICKNISLGGLYYGWNVATDIEIDLAPTICAYSKGGSGFQILTGTSGTKYVCDNGKTRLATQEEIDAWNLL